jgi:RNA polymerase sigma-70 factor (ECF subfamily)
MIDHRSDARLVGRVLAGDPWAAGTLYDRHWRTAWRAAVAVLGSAADAEDVATEAWLRAIDALDECLPRENFGPWLRRIAVNRAIDVLRRRRFVTPLDEAAEVAGSFVPSYFTGAYERSEADLSYLPMAQLPARIRELLQNLGQACDPISLTSDEMRVLLETFEANGITPSQSEVGFYGFDLPGREQHPSFLHFTAAIPEDTPSSPGRCG